MDDPLMKVVQSKTLFDIFGGLTCTTLISAVPPIVASRPLVRALQDSMETRRVHCVLSGCCPSGPRLLDERCRSFAVRWGVDVDPVTLEVDGLDAPVRAEE